FRIYRSGGGGESSDIPAPLARTLAAEASRTAQQFFTICVRALDYCPPVDITFGDFLRAVITSDFDLHPTDASGIRSAFMGAFRVRGIVPDGAAFFSETAIAWPAAKGLAPIENLDFGDPNGLTPDQQKSVKEALRAYFDDPEHLRAMGFDEGLAVRIPSFHPVFRIGEDGGLRTEMVIEVVQERQVHFDDGAPGLGTFPMRGGATIIIGKPSFVDARRQHFEGGGYKPQGQIRYVIAKHLHGNVGDAREGRQRLHYQRLGLVEGDDPERFTINFALTHGGF